LSTIRIEEESEAPRGWSFQVAVMGDDGTDTRHCVRLSWVDYDHWSHGSTPPALVAQAVVRFLLDRGETVPARFDAATLRRRFPDFDDTMGGRP